MWVCTRAIFCLFLMAACTGHLFSSRLSSTNLMPTVCLCVTRSFMRFCPGTWLGEDPHADTGPACSTKTPFFACAGKTRKCSGRKTKLNN